MLQVTKEAIERARQIDLLIILLNMDKKITRLLIGSLLRMRRMSQ